MIETIIKYIEPEIEDPNHRYKSWEHCFKAFTENKENEILSLNLAFYLASWGMYRGSSGLLWKDYKIHIQAIDILKSFNDLKSLSWNKPNIARILELKGQLVDYYGNIDFYNGKGQGFKKITATDTLISKIILGTLGCLPAFDRYFNIGYKGNSNVHINQLILEDLYSLIDQKINEIGNCQNIIKQKLKFDYPVMKIIDMYYWQIGFDML